MEHGEETIRRVREKTPHVYLASIVSLLPKQAQKVKSPFAELDDDELQRLEDYLTALRAGTIKQIDAVAELVEPAQIASRQVAKEKLDGD